MPDRLVRQFENPANTHRFAPFWFWNHELADDELRWQIREMRDKGVGGFVMHARHGLTTPYLSREWFDRIATGVREAERLNMVAYLYDENNWPSGPADGKVTDEHPEYRMTGVYLAEEWKANGGDVLEGDIPTGDGLIAVVAVPTERGKLVGVPERVVNLADAIDGNHLRWEAPEGRWRVMAFARRVYRGMFHGSYLDVINPDAVRRFIEITHVPYTDRFRQYFGNVIDGIFTDEPGMNYFFDDNVHQWTARLPEEFRWRKGYDLILALPALFEDAGSETARIRCDYWDTITDLYVNAYFRQIYEFCDPLKLKSIGHVDFEGELYQSVRQHGDFFRGARWMHYGGVDFLCELTWPEGDRAWGLNNLVGPKMASSAAHLLGKPRVMSECFGLASQWAINLRNLKWMSDWQIALGVNLLQPHAFYYSIQGFRKWECPPDEFYRAPYWRHYRLLSDYVARLCTLFSGGQHIARVAVIYPNKAMWAAMGPGKNEDTERIVDGFERVTQALLRIHRDFDIVPEEMLVEGAHPDGGATYLLGGLAIVPPGGEADQPAHVFSAVIVPARLTVTPTVARALYDLFNHGQTVVIVGQTPWHPTVRESDAETRGFLAEIFGTDKPDRTLRADNDAGGHAFFFPDLETAPLAEVEQTLKDALDGVLDSQVAITEDGRTARDVICLRYRKDDRDLYLLVNTSRERGYQAKIVLEGTGQPQFWNAHTGEITPAASYEEIGGKVALDIEFEPTESFVISVPAPNATPEKAAPRRRTRASRRQLVMALPNEWSFRTERPNALPLRDWRYRMDAAVQGRDSANGFHVYEATFQVDRKPRRCRLAMDGLVIEKVWHGTAPINVEVSLNDQQMGPFAQGEYLDHLIVEADVTKLVQRGENRIEIRTAAGLHEPGNLSHPPYLIGDFALEQRDGEWVIAAPTRGSVHGSWTEFGYPYYSGVGVYQQTLSLPKRPVGKRMALRITGVTDLIEVWVNGKLAGVRPWEPYEVDVTDSLRRGRNEIEIKVANTLENLVVMSPRPCGLLGEVQLISR